MIDSAENVAEGAELRADICIVGAGAAGISLALALGGVGLQVLLLEGGLEQPDAASQDLYDGEVADPAMHSPPRHYRSRQLGGATTIWGGRCVPFDPQDFEPRAAVPHSGWPIDRREVERFLPAANRLLEAGVAVYQASGALGSASPPMLARAPGLRLTVDGLERFSCPTNFGTRYRGRLQRMPGLRLLTGANCTRIALQPGAGAVRALEFSTLAGRRFGVVAQVAVLAVGGLETPRLLLASNDVLGSGVGNAHDVVGRYYMCHLAGSVGNLTLDGRPEQVRHGYELTTEGVYCRRRIALTAETQARLGVANMVARLHFPAVANPSHRSSVLSGIFLVRRLLSHEYSRRVANADEVGPWARTRHLANILRYPHDAASFLVHWTLQRKLASRKFPSVILKNRNNRFSLEVNAEQAPLAESRVTLIDRRDPLGTPRLRVDWRYSESDIDSVARSLEVIAEEFAATGAGSFEFDRTTLRDDLTRYGAYGGHHIGTARMGNDPRTSVVDADARVHGVQNLYVAGSAVFPTSSQANPTLVLVALALRLGQHLAERLTGRPHDVAEAVA